MHTHAGIAHTMTACNILGEKTEGFGGGGVRSLLHPLVEETLKNMPTINASIIISGHYNTYLVVK